jgi:outer membrane lipoprotein-sorting protein
VLPAEEMPRLLFDALAPTKARMQKGFAVEGCAEVEGAPTRRLLTLVPTEAKTKRVASKITLLLDTQGPRLCGFGYQDPRGDNVRVELSEPKVTTKVDEALFVLDVPKDAKVTVQHIPEQQDPEEQTPEATPGKRDAEKRDR